MTNAAKFKKWTWLNLLLLIVTIAVNYSGAAGFINGMTQKAVSAKFSTLITPAGYAFAIWGVIYVLLAATMIQLILKHKQSNYEQLISDISPLFWLSVVFNIAWTISFSYLNMLVAFAFIVALLLTLKLICLKLANYKNKSQFSLASSAFGLYAGWVSVASVVNLAAFTVQIQWNGFGFERPIWAMLALVFALLIATLITLKIKNVIYLLAVIWAFVAILMAHQNPEIFNNAYSGIKMTLMIGIAYLVGLTAGVVFKKVRG